MSRLTIVPVTPLGSAPTLPLDALSAAIAFTPASAFADGIGFANTGREVLIVHNTDVSNPRTVTITSAADSAHKRTGDITAYSIPAAGFAFFGPFDPAGWNQTNGQVYAAGSTADLEFAIIKTVVTLFPVS